MCHFLKSSYNPNELLSGTLFFNNTDNAKNLINDWIDYNDTNALYDQKNLQHIYETKHKGKINWKMLPREYIIIERSRHHNDVPQDTRVICHFQASRRFKRIINGRK